MCNCGIIDCLSVGLCRKVLAELAYLGDIGNTRVRDGWLSRFADLVALSHRVLEQIVGYGARNGI